MKIQNDQKANFKGHITVSRIHNEPNGEAIIKAIAEAVESFRAKAKAFDCDMFGGVYKDAKTGNTKFLVSTDHNGAYRNTHGDEKLAQRLAELDIPLLNAIKEIKAKFKTPNTKNACLISAADSYSKIMQQKNRIIKDGRVAFIDNEIIVGIPTKTHKRKADSFIVYDFLLQDDGSFVANSKIRRRNLY